MRIVTTNTGVITFYMRMFGVVNLAIIFISALDLGSVECCSGSIIMDVAEAEFNVIALIILDRGNNGIRVFSFELCDLRIHRSLGLTSLVADEAARRITKTLNDVRDRIAIRIEFITREGNL